MSDPMRPPMGGGGMPQGPQGPSPMAGRGPAPSGRESLMNPNDMAKKMSTGEVSPDMTIREFYQGMGLDVDSNTLADLAKAMQGQAKNATMVGKMRNTQGGVAAQPPAAPPQGGGMAGLMSKMGGSPPTNGRPY